MLTKTVLQASARRTIMSAARPSVRVDIISDTVWCVWDVNHTDAVIDHAFPPAHGVTLARSSWRLLLRE